MENAPDRSNWYATLAAGHRAQRAGQARAVERLGAVRLATFVAAVLAVARWASSNVARNEWLAAALIVTAAFVWMVRTSRRAKHRLHRTDDLIALADAGGHRVARAWDRLPNGRWPAEPAAHPYAVDLDVFGPASLTQLMPPMSDTPGRATLRAWLVAPAEPEQIRARQRAVDELRDRYEFRDELAMAGMRITATPDGVQQLARWAAATGWLTRRPALLAASVVVPLATMALVVAQTTGFVAHAYWIAPALVGWILTVRSGRSLTASFAPVVGQANALRRYAGMARLVAGERFASPALLAIHQRLAGPPRPAHLSMRALTALADCTELRLSPMLYFVVNTLTLWDFHVAHLLERWQRTHGRRVADWLAALGELEALSALATLAFDNPEWSFSEIAPRDHATVDAEALGHPLLPPAVGVRNDVSVGPAGAILVITGSNMAGKSTLLRSIGLNLVLSQAGSAVCARRFVHPPAGLYTSMRIDDSLERGVSHFMAELQRLKAVVDAADAARSDAPRALVYLLDEILHGTNSAERTIAARYVLSHLARTGAIGAVTTHDLQLVDAPELAAVARHVHFSEQFTRTGGVPAMSFDYTLRPGKATSSNALKLLELVGLTPPG